jgi:hypothetical protein
MGTYVYTARATGRVPAIIGFEHHQIFPMKYSFKPWWGHPRNEAWWATAEAQAARIEKRDDWTGYVSYAGNVYKVASALWSDHEPLGRCVGQLYAGPNGLEVR